MSIYVTVKDLSAPLRAQIQRAAGGEAVMFASDSGAGASGRTGVAEATIVFGNVPCGWLMDAPKVEWVQLDSAGFWEYRSLVGRPGGAPRICNLKDFFGEAVAETAIGGILALFRQIHALSSRRESRQWLKGEVEPHMRTLYGKTVLIAGNGAIGRALARMLEAFSCNVLRYGRTVSTEKGRLSSIYQLDRALPDADIVALCLPETEETNGLFDRERLALLKPSGILVNVGRGCLVDEEALVERLRSGQLQGAVLDVTRREPLAKDDPLWAFPNVVLTHHTGGRFENEAEAKVSFFLRNLERFRAGAPLEGEVNWARGY